MRVCPKCGYHDSPIWRNSRFYFNVDVAKKDDLQIWHPDLLEKITKDGYYEDSIFAYLLQAGGSIILRKEIELLNKDIDGDGATQKKERWFTISVERHRKKKLDDKFQTKLLEVTK